VLQPGARIGRYEIVSLLGEGGMGQVYRARDATLGRDVAVKVIATDRAVDSEQQRRFEHEARAAAALNHPNIIAVYDVGAHEGMPYIVSELLEGATLRERSSDGPLSGRKAIEYATQMARALSAAHERKIVHRDLKPENVFVLRDGRIKILDFGLAKLAAEGGSPGVSQLVTSDGGTTPGTVMGTVGYMSPEQVRGEPVDHRTDIFALGAILYEMLTGRRAFQGRTAADTMTAVLREDPAPITRNGSGVQVPAACERIIGYCLEKDANLRLQSAHDVAIALEATIGSSSAVAPSAPPPRRSPLRQIAAAALLAAAAAGIPAYFAGLSSSQPAVLPEFSRIAFQASNVNGARFLPEQSGVVYSGVVDNLRARVFMTRLGSPDATPLSEPGMRLAGVARTGELAVLRNFVASPAAVAPGHATLARMPAAGGIPRDVVEGIEYADWGPDDNTFVVVRTIDGRRRVEFPVGTSLFETTGWVDSPRVSPDGRRVAFAEHPILGDDRGWAMVVDTATKRAERLSAEYASLRGVVWHPTSGEVYVGAGSQIEVIGRDATPRVIARTTEGNYLHDVARDGRLLVTYSTFELRAHLLLPTGEWRGFQWLDRTVPIAFWPGGDRLLFWEAAEYGIYSRALDGSPAVRLGDGFGLALSPDGRSALAIQLTTPMQLIVYPTGAGESRQLPTASIERIFGGGWTPDGAAVVFAAQEPGQPGRLYKQRLTDTRPTRIGSDGLTLPSPFGAEFVSPDGAFVVASSPSHELVRVPLDGGPVTLLTGVRPGDQPLGWDAEPGMLIVAEGGNQWPLTLVRVDLGRGTRTVWRQIDGPPDAPQRFTPAVLSPDRKTLAFINPQSRTTLYVVAFPLAR
jgi:serine/threonine protein kinase/Tol biopolymer transport system component